MSTKETRTIGVVVERIREDPPAFRAGVVWGAIPWVAGVEQGETPEQAVAALEERMRHLGREAVAVVFDTVEDAQREGRRRLAAEDLLRTLAPARERLSEVLAVEGAAPDDRDREAFADLNRAILAVRAVADGTYDDGKRDDTPPIRDGRIVCPNEGCDRPGAYFTATADALATVHLSPTGDLRTWKNAAVSDEGYREVRCGLCGRLLGDLVLEDLQALGDRPKKEE